MTDESATINLSGQRKTFMLFVRSDGPDVRRSLRQNKSDYF